ncbi:MAG: hypothetical protein LBC95_01880 [Candidatus Nomurabacteria bacterium]|nr:hypothetical protein [Candidatus Nomurabacteria bacterium]
MRPKISGISQFQSNITGSAKRAHEIANHPMTNATFLSFSKKITSLGTEMKTGAKKATRFPITGKPL